MAVRRPLIDVIDRGLDPRVAHSKLDKKGVLVVNRGVDTPVLPPAKMKETIIKDEKKDIITEGEETAKLEAKSEDKIAEKKDEAKVAPKPESKKTDKTPKPV